MSFWLWALVVAFCTFDLTRKTLDRIARWRHWRIGDRLGRILCIWQRVGEGCLRCGTDYRYVRAHPTPYGGHDKTDARVLVALCACCWSETDISERLIYHGLVLKEWQRDGLAGEEWDEARTAVYAATVAGL